MSNDVSTEANVRVRFYIEDSGVGLAFADRLDSPEGSVLVTRQNWADYFNDTTIDPRERSIVCVIMTATEWPSVNIHREGNLTMFFEHNAEWRFPMAVAGWRPIDSMEYVQHLEAILQVFFPEMESDMPFSRDEVARS